MIASIETRTLHGTANNLENYNCDLTSAMSCEVYLCKLFHALLTSWSFHAIKHYRVHWTIKHENDRSLKIYDKSRRLLAIPKSRILTSPDGICSPSLWETTSVKLLCWLRAPAAWPIQECYSRSFGLPRIAYRRASLGSGSESTPYTLTSILKCCWNCIEPYAILCISLYIGTVQPLRIQIYRGCKLPWSHIFNTAEISLLSHK